jgi:hypothetical protein
MAATRRGSAIRERKNVRALVISYRYRRQATWIAFAMYFKSGAVRAKEMRFLWLTFLTAIVRGPRAGCPVPV